MRPLLDMLLPPTCPGCGREGRVLCDACRAPLARRLDEPAGLPIGLPSSMPRGVVQLEWCAAFTGPVRAALHALKYDGEQRLAVPLGAFMAERWRRVGMGGDLLVPVPVHDSRRRERGFDQAELLAGVVGRQLAIPVSPLLERRAETAAQHQLGRRARAGNVASAFVVKETALRRVDLARRWVVLIDDVMTTGATLAGCAAALHAAGVDTVSALTVARER